MQLDVEDLDPVLKRLRRAQGQLGAVIRMIEEERDCRDIGGEGLLDRLLGEVDVAEGADQDRDSAPVLPAEDERDVDLAAMEKLFLSLA